MHSERLVCNWLISNGENYHFNRAGYTSLARVSNRQEFPEPEAGAEMGLKSG